jgi:acetyl-CoA carboxylase carboxyl transferase subunit beta
VRRQFDNSFVELDKPNSKDPLHFVDTKKICRSIERCNEKTKLKDAVCTGVGKSKGKELKIVVWILPYWWFYGS